MKTPALKRTNTLRFLSLLTISVLISIPTMTFSSNIRHTENFCKNWRFHLGDVANGQEGQLDDSQWRTLDLPHDWSIEGEFNKDNPATPGGGALPGGISSYRNELYP